MPPKPRKPVQSAKAITRVKKAVPKISTRPPTKGPTKPKTTGSKEPRNPAKRPGSQSIPYKGPGPMGQGVF